MDKLHLIMPMGGRGVRFFRDGFVTPKPLIELEGKPFKEFAAHRDVWAKETCYVYPGPIQYWGPTEVCDTTTKTLALEHE